MATGDNGHWFYDFAEPHQFENGFVEVERVYCLDWDAFHANDWRALEEAERSLPGWIGPVPERADQCPYWFGTDEERGSYVWASVEPPGLQVVGFLPEADWRRWDEAFRQATTNLPWRGSR